MIEIKSRHEGEILHCVDAKSLEGADLSGLDLSWADFRMADLTTVDLSGANLSRADLRYANLYLTDLSDADLTGAELVGASINGADLIATNLKKALFGHTIVVGCETLYQALNIDQVRHFGRSFLGLETLRTNVEYLPIQFLRGVGIPDTEIRALRSLYAASAIEFYSCFISYSHKDKSFARRLHDQLQAQGIRCWLDEHQILPGDHLMDQVDRGIKMWDKVLLCASQHSLKSWWVDDEMERAFAKEKRLSNARDGKKALALVPLNLDGYLLSGQWESSKAEQVLSRLAADFTGWEKDNAKFEEQFERLVKALRTDEKARETPPEPKLPHQP